MQALDQLKELGLVLPSPAYIFGAILFGIIGLAVFVYGKKKSAPMLKWTGVALMFYPYAVSQTWLLWAVGLALCGWVYVNRQ